MYTPRVNPRCAAFKEYKEMPEMVPLDFLEGNVTWVVSKLSGTAEALRELATDPRNWVLHFRCALKEFRVVVANLANWMATPPLPLG